MSSSGLAVVAVLAAMAVIFVVGVRVLDPDRRPGAPIVVVDARTLRLAAKRVAEAEERGDLVRAYGGAVAVTQWLRYEVRTGPRRRRLRRARELEWWELRRRELMSQMTARM